MCRGSRNAKQSLLLDVEVRERAAFEDEAHGVRHPRPAITFEPSIHVETTKWRQRDRQRERERDERQIRKKEREREITERSERERERKRERERER